MNSLASVWRKWDSVGPDLLINLLFCFGIKMAECIGP